MKTLLVSAFLLVVSGACTSINDSATDTALLQLNVNREKWQSEAIRDYSFDYDVAAMIQTRPLHIVVRADTVNQVTDRVTGDLFQTRGTRRSILFLRECHHSSRTRTTESAFSTTRHWGSPRASRRARTSLTRATPSPSAT